MDFKQGDMSMLMNYENDKKALEEQAEKSAEVNKGLLNEIAQKKADIENVESYIIALQDLMKEAYIQKEVLEKECESLEAEYNKKKTLTEAIGKLFKRDKKTVNSTVETVGSSNDAMGFTQKMTSALNKLRYDFRKGAITEDEFKERVNALLKESIDKDLE